MKRFSIHSRERTDFVNITRQVQDLLTGTEGSGIVTVFIPHTTAGVTINENADPDVVSDMKTALDQLIPWRSNYRHAEGNSAAHLKCTLTGSSVHVPFEAGRLMLGTWQSIYFCEFDGPRSRNVWVQITT